MQSQDSETSPGPFDFNSHTESGLLAALLATAVDGIIVIDPNGNVLLYNQACEKLFGYRAKEVVGRNVKMLMPEPYRQEHDNYLANYNRSGERRIIGVGREVVGRRKDGSTFPMYLSVGEGGLVGQRFFVGIIHDLSALRWETERREGADRLLAQIVQSSEDAIISVALDGTITSWNAAAERIYGFGPSEAIGRHISMILPPDRLKEGEEIMANMRVGRSMDHYETVRRHKNGRDVLVSLSVAPILNAAGVIIGASKTARDVTERKRSEEQLLGMQNELAHVARLSAMGQMSAAIAHELNQPLTAIANYSKAAQRLLQNENLEPRQLQSAREAMEKAVTQTLRAGTIIRYLRDFVEKRESRKALEDMNQVIREAVSLGMVGHSHSSVKLSLALHPNLPRIPMDKVQMQQVLLNLVRNAMEAMAAVEVRELAISSTLDAEGVCVSVRDSGPGLAPQVLSRLFQPFVTTKADGMGIGLKICQSIIEGHGGRIAARQEGGGATFVIHLPLSSSDENIA
ncbi:MAG: PAS domain S-box protein [Acetobacteraceae bacterium]|nr:PAS domain S-box protein [Acetobacteraceae bacterium]